MRRDDASRKGLEPVQLPTFLVAMRAEQLSLFERTLRELYATRTPFVQTSARHRG